ncbi:receptor-like protein 42 [Bidens hawaiensis]|uniref:receptor-like protein 42 n=1 Tax=Bidens hawaiensis TaxID=980011 RepID=UPI00404B226C
MAFSFIQIISFIYLLVTSPCIASLLSHHKECLALFEFKQSFLHQPYASFDVGKLLKLDSWRKITSNTSNHDFDCCLWDGVKCSDKGHVIGIDLSQSSLHGSMKSNSSLFNLVHLQMLNLSMNDFVESQIPSEIARLKQLRRLDLSNSSFAGQIPIEISYLMQLTLLDLSWNPLKLQSPSFEELLQNLTSLEELHLSSVDISSFIPPFLSNFSYLRSIDLESCRLRDQFPSKILHLPKLKFLNMANNPILTGSLPEFQNNTLLEHLDLYSTSFAGSIPESISKLNHLVYLSLDECYFSGCIPFSLSNMTQLTSLSLGQDEAWAFALAYPSHLSKPTGLEICEKRGMHDWISKLINLESMSLVQITMYDEILPSLANLTKLNMVILMGNHIFGHIPSSFMNLTRLRMIYFIETQLQGQISSSLSNFKSLEVLCLMYNNFSGRLELDTFVGLTKLRYLYLDGNRLSFVTTKNHTSEENLPEFEVIGLSSCKLTKFPSFLRLQKKLIYLLLPNNKIEGLVPEWILNNIKETLLGLELTYNSITGFHRHPNFLPWARLEVLELG